MSRRLLVFLLIDLVVVVVLVTWWWTHRGPASVPPTTPQAAPMPPAAALAPTETPAKAAPALTAPAGQVELHGTFHGQPFWARLGAPAPEYGGRRQLELVYTPPTPEAVDGSLIHDSPLLLVDDHLALVAWNNRDGGTGITTTAAPAGYKVVREIHAAEKVDLLVRVLVGGPAWDLRLAPVLLALAWRADAGERAIRVVDFWGPRAAEKLALSVRGAEITVAGETWTAEADAEGRLKRLIAADGGEFLSVSGRP